MSRAKPGLARSLLFAVVALLLLCVVATVAEIAPRNSSLSSPSSGSGLSADAINLGNAVSTSCHGVATCTTPALTGVGVGDTLVVIVTEHTTTAGNPSSVVEVTSGGNNPLTLLGSSGCTVLGHGVVAIYGLANVSAQASVTFTVNYAGDEYYTIHALDVQGTAASPFETAGPPVCSAAAGTTATANVTATVPNDLVILGVEVRADEEISATGGDSVVTLQEIGGDDSDSGSMLDESDAATGLISLSATFGSAQWAAQAIALKPSSALSGLTPGIVSPAAATIDASQTVGLTSTAASGGSGHYAYQWLTGASTCSSGTAISGATGLTYTTPALSVGTDYYCVEVTDTSTHDVAYTNVATITVDPALAVTITPAAPSIDPGQNITLTANPTGGTGEDSYAWYAGATCSGTGLGTNQSYTTPALSADTTYCVAATDSAYQPATATATDTVTVSSASLSVSISPYAPSIDSGQTVTLTANPSGGTGADRYAWYAGPTCSGTVLATVQSYDTGTLTASTTYCVAATDSAYQPARATATDTVTVSADPLSVTITPPAPSIDSGQTVTLTAQPVGGTGAVSFAWYAGAACSGTVLGMAQSYTTPALSANTTFCVAVTDSAFQPASATAAATVAVSAATHPGGGTGSGSGFLSSVESSWWLLLLLAVVVLFLLVVFGRRRRRKEDQVPPGEMAASTTAGLGTASASSGSGVPSSQPPGGDAPPRSDPVPDSAPSAASHPDVTVPAPSGPAAGESESESAMVPSSPTDVGPSGPTSEADAATPVGPGTEPPLMPSPSAHVAQDPPAQDSFPLPQSVVSSQPAGPGPGVSSESSAVQEADRPVGAVQPDAVIAPKLPDDTGPGEPEEDPPIPSSTASDGTPSESMPPAAWDRAPTVSDGPAPESTPPATWDPAPTASDAPASESTPPATWEPAPTVPPSAPHRSTSRRSLVGSPSEDPEIGE